jgi:hypothetical protein
MKHRDIAAVRARVEKCVAGLPDIACDPDSQYSALEMICIQVLDSEHDLFPPGQLQELLSCYLTIRQIELGLFECSAPAND